MHVIIIIPLYNEDHLDSLLEQIDNDHTVLLIDDGSDKFINKRGFNKKVKTATHSVNLGQGAALQTGFEIARLLKPKYVITMDADGQHDVKDIDRFINKIESTDVDVVFGRRSFKTKGKLSVPFLRKIILKFAILFDHFYTGVKLHDSHNGYRIMNKNAYTEINLREARMEHATEFLEQVKKHNFKYTELDINIQYTAYSKAKGQSNLNAISILKNLLLRRL
jgi:polyprenyl-phospho-N-acetylgalactosaminyl synthase